jgi:hypothetical protein
MTGSRLGRVGLALSVCLVAAGAALVSANSASAAGELSVMKMTTGSPCANTGCLITITLEGQDRSVVPTGTVEFTADSNNTLHSTNGGLCASLPLKTINKGTARASCTAFIPRGNDALGASYSGDQNYPGKSTQAFPRIQSDAIHKVTVSGAATDPTITIRGDDFGTEPTWAAEPALCHGSGSNYGASGSWIGEPLYIQDTSANWTAGQPDDCVGLLVSSYSSHEIVLTFGSYYDLAGSKTPDVLANGATFTINLFGVTKVEKAKYSS